MKTDDQIKAEISQISFMRSANKAHAIIQAKQFYTKYPQYGALAANGVFFINASLELGPVTVWKFSNGDLLFLGDIMDQNNAPLAGIGEGLPLPLEFRWDEPESFLEKVETLT